MKIMNATYFEGEWCEGAVSILIYQREKSADFSLWLFYFLFQPDKQV